MRYVTDVKIAANGGLVLPEAVREALGLSGEATLLLTIEGDEVRLSPRRHAVLRAQKLYRDSLTGGISVDDFLAERRLEAARDDHEE